MALLHEFLEPVNLAFQFVGHDTMMVSPRINQEHEVRKRNSRYGNIHRLIHYLDTVRKVFVMTKSNRLAFDCVHEYLLRLSVQVHSSISAALGGIN